MFNNPIWSPWFLFTKLNDNAIIYNRTFKFSDILEKIFLSKSLLIINEFKKQNILKGNIDLGIKKTDNFFSSIVENIRKISVQSGDDCLKKDKNIKKDKEEENYFTIINNYNNIFNFFKTSLKNSQDDLNELFAKDIFLYVRKRIISFIVNYVFKSKYNIKFGIINADKEIDLKTIRDILYIHNKLKPFNYISDINMVFCPFDIKKSLQKYLLI